MSTAAMLVYPDFFKVAVSSSGNHENNVYNRWWSEKHHGVKEVTDKDGKVKFEYSIDRNSDIAKNLKGHLLLVTGDMDDNVHPAGTLRVADALIKANKRFDFFIMPGQRHGYATMGDYFFWLRADYFAKHLLGQASESVDLLELSRETPQVGKRRPPAAARDRGPSPSLPRCAFRAVWPCFAARAGARLRPRRAGRPRLRRDGRLAAPRRRGRARRPHRGGGRPLGGGGQSRLDARGLAVAPGFINMLSWSTESLLVDGRSQGEIRQGVTTQIFGEGESDGPAGREEMKKLRRGRPGRRAVRHRLDHPRASTSRTSRRRGVSQNVASYIGAATLREHVIGLDDRPRHPRRASSGCGPSCAQEMEAGALGIGSSLIYAPAIYAYTEELIELCKVAAPYQGKYISHMRSEGDRLLESVDELIRIAREAEGARGDLSPEGGGGVATGQDGRGDPQGRGGAGAKA